MIKRSEKYLHLSEELFLQSAFHCNAFSFSAIWFSCFQKRHFSIIKAPLLQKHACNALQFCLCSQLTRFWNRVDQICLHVMFCRGMNLSLWKSCCSWLYHSRSGISKMKTAYVATIKWCKLHLINNHQSLITFMQIASSTQETYYRTPDLQYWKNNRLDQCGYPSYLSHARAKLKHCYILQTRQVVCDLTALTRSLALYCTSKGSHHPSLASGSRLRSERGQRSYL